MHVKIVRQPGSWAGEEAILAAADFLKSEVHVYIATAASSPLVNKPTSVAASGVSNRPVSIAFYEPGHYKSVVSIGVPADRLNYLRRWANKFKYFLTQDLLQINGLTYVMQLTYLMLQ